MAGLTDRKKSRLAAVHPATPAEPMPSPPEPPASAPEPAPAPPPATAQASRPARRGRVARRVEKPSPMDMVSFNCNLTRGARSAAKMYAAEIDVALQDVVEAALIEYLEPRGYPIRRRPGAPELP